MRFSSMPERRLRTGKKLAADDRTSVGIVDEVEASGGFERSIQPFVIEQGFLVGGEGGEFFVGKLGEFLDVLVEG